MDTPTPISSSFQISVRNCHLTREELENIMRLPFSSLNLENVTFTDISITDVYEIVEPNISKITVDTIDSDMDGQSSVEYDVSLLDCIPRTPHPSLSLNDISELHMDEFLSSGDNTMIPSSSHYKNEEERNGVYV